MCWWRTTAVAALGRKPGDLAIWSNGRVMHGREGYERGAPRHLQGAYLDYDEIQSAVRAALAEGKDLERFSIHQIE